MNRKIELKKINDAFKEYKIYSGGEIVITKLSESLDYIHADVMLEGHVIFRNDIPEIVQSIVSKGYRKTLLRIVYKKED